MRNMNAHHAHDSGNTTATTRRAMAVGALLWLALAMIMVTARGLRWDESYEHAQIIAGEVHYPAGHPHAVYARNAFTVQSTVSALQLKLGAGPWGVEFLRNVVFLWATVLPPCLLAIALTRRRWPGHVAALLTLGGVFLAFDGSYPLMVWPETYSNGHIGGGWALVALALLIGGQVRAGALLFGLLPAVHVGQWPVLLGWMGCAGAWLAYQRAWTPLRQGVGWAAVGLAITGAYAAFHLFVLRAPMEGAITEEARELWAAFTRHHDIHRRPPGVNGQIMIVGTLALCAIAALHPPRPAMRMPVLGITLYAVGVAAAVWSAQGLTAAFGENVPFLVQAWMPYRMVNHLPACFAALVVAMLLGRGAVPWPVIALAGYTIMFALMPFALRAAEGSVVARMLGAYFGEGEAVVFFLFGAAVTVAAPAPAIIRWGVVLVCVASLALFHQFGASIVLLGAVAGELGKGLRAFEWRRPAMQAAIFAAVLIVLVGHQARYRVSLPVPPFQARVAQLLQDQPGVLLVTGPFPFLWQAQTGVATFTDATTHSLVSYLPALAPRIEAMYNGVYGISLREPAFADYRETWSARNTTTWHELAAQWQFTHVAAPATVSIALPILIEEDGWRLYDAALRHE
jgi:hypothetical protein